MSGISCRGYYVVRVGGAFFYGVGIFDALLAGVLRHAMSRGGRSWQTCAS